MFAQAAVKGDIVCTQSLVYLQIRATLVEMGGGGGEIHVTKELASRFSLSFRSLKEYLNKGVKQGWYVKLGLNKYRLVSLYKVSPVVYDKDGKVSKYQEYFEVDNVTLSNLSWKNIATFRAFLSEEVLNKRVRTWEITTNYVARKEAARQIDQEALSNPHGYSRPNKHRTKPPITTIGEFPVSCSFPVKDIGRTKKTVHNYRALVEKTLRTNVDKLPEDQLFQSVSVFYRTNKITVGNLYDDSGWDVYYIAQQNRFIEDNYESLPVERKGRYQYCTVSGRVWFNGVTDRVSLGHKQIKRRRTPAKYLVSPAPFCSTIKGSLSVESFSVNTPY
ncbi:hypothetical protein [Fibrella forsythiae]|uniref:DNA-binding protein n=1 Tax=Fibrella forsythiae TaxID=2817061 RepID=A0ABS3JPT6_9BACT|nr:hypothetical protein [Fibrella forsythiae]MBO0952020.1 hypothetical protein [Fibrella forsythiae]